jgi:nucleoside 2-deoxyribosyltransferase
MNIYIAAPWTHRHTDAQQAHDLCTAAGLTCVSTWTTRKILGSEDDPVVHSREAVSDLRDLDQARALIMLNLAKSEGKATEVGYALAREIPVIVVGPRTGNVFYSLPQVIQVDTIQEAIVVIRELSLDAAP